MVTLAVLLLKHWRSLTSLFLVMFAKVLVIILYGMFWSYTFTPIWSSKLWWHKLNPASTKYGENYAIQIPKSSMSVPPNLWRPFIGRIFTYTISRYLHYKSINIATLQKTMFYWMFKSCVPFLIPLEINKGWYTFKISYVKLDLYFPDFKLIIIKFIKLKLRLSWIMQILIINKNSNHIKMGFGKFCSFHKNTKF